FATHNGYDLTLKTINSIEKVFACQRPIQYRLFLYGVFHACPLQGIFITSSCISGYRINSLDTGTPRMVSRTTTRSTECNSYTLVAIDNRCNPRPSTDPFGVQGWQEKSVYGFGCNSLPATGSAGIWSMDCGRRPPSLDRLQC